MNHIKLISIFIMMMFALSACERDDGIDDDVEEIGEEIEDAAN